MEELTEERLEEIREKFAEQARLYKTATWVFGLVSTAIPAALLATMEEYRSGLIGFLLLIIMFGVLVYVIRVRCPACNKHVIELGANFCSGCGVPLK